MSQIQSPKICVYAGFARRLRRVADGRVELRDAVIEDRILLGARVPVALFRDHVEELRALELLDVRQRAGERVDVVAVDRPDVVEPELLEQRAGQQHPLRVLFPALRELLDRRQLRQDFLAAAAHRVVEARREELREIAVERAHRLGDRHLVVVEDHEEVGAGDARVVERLERHAGTHRAVADHRDHAPIVAVALRGDRHAERRRDRRRRVRGSERVVFALGPARKARRAAGHPQPAHLASPAGEDLVRVRLVADVPHDPVARRVERVMERDRELDRAEIRRQVSSRLRDRGQHERAQLARELRQEVAIETAQRRGTVDRVEER